MSSAAALTCAQPPFPNTNSVSMPDRKLKLAFLVDPWGIRTELTEGLERNPR
jgi:hypothetical protein